MAGSFRNLNLSGQFDVGDHAVQSGRPVTTDSLAYNLLRDGSSACCALLSGRNEQKVAKLACKEGLPRSCPALSFIGLGTTSALCSGYSTEMP